jgi:hypothetical protein
MLQNIFFFFHWLKKEYHKNINICFKVKIAKCFVECCVCHVHVEQA